MAGAVVDEHAILAAVEHDHVAVAVVTAKLLAGGMTPAVIAEKLGQAETPPSWPFERAAWKPKTPREDLVRAGALIAAEIARLDRMSKEEPRT